MPTWGNLASCRALAKSGDAETPATSQRVGWQTSRGRGQYLALLKELPIRAYRKTETCSTGCAQTSIDQATWLGSRPCARLGLSPIAFYRIRRIPRGSR